MYLGGKKGSGELKTVFKDGKLMVGMESRGNPGAGEKEFINRKMK